MGDHRANIKLEFTIHGKTYKHEFEWMMKIEGIQGEIIESYLKLRIRKKPPYLPNFLWKFILSKLVYIQYFKD